jgi:hypothetical protein
MRKSIFSVFILLCLFTGIQAQNTVKGIVLDGDFETPLPNVNITVKQNLLVKTITNKDGFFELKNLLNESYILQVKFQGYETQNFPLEFSGETINLEEIYLFKDFIEEQDLGLITITDDELNDDASASDNITGLLQATKDIYLRTAAFEFSSSFFSIKGLDSGNGKMLINGIEMNKVNDGRAQWSNWGGLNDVLRNQEFSNGLTPSNYSFGGVLGTTNMNTQASLQNKGTKISYASSNRSYQHRVMATYATGLMPKNWALTLSASKRIGEEGFTDGTSYNATSFFAAFEQKIGEKHSVNITSIFASNKRGKAAPATQEVIDIKGISYNEYWGFLNGRKQNSRSKEVAEPIFILSHFWNPSNKTSLQTNVAYQYGKIGNSRLDFNGGANPSPIYYQYLPSFQLRKGNLSNAYLVLQEFQENGQLDWEAIFIANTTRAEMNTEAAYVLYEDRNDENQFTINTILNTELSKNITLNAKLSHKKIASSNFAEIIDLLGNDIGYLDINPFADVAIQKQNNVLTPDRIVKEGDLFRYNYNLSSTITNTFIQTQFKYKKVDFFTAFDLSNTNHQREGLYQNGRFLENSLGKSNQINFTNFSTKGGATYKINGRHILDFNLGYLSNAPTIRNSFSNVRENNSIVDNLKSERTLTSDFSYIFRSPLVTGKLTSYYTNIKDATEISFYFADGVGGDNTAFVQEVLSEIQKEHLGLELGVEAQVTPTIKIKGVAALGQFIYKNNPNLYLTSDVANNGGFDSNFRSKDYVANLKNYKIASGPQRAYSLGFEYRDPDYWWFGATTNLFSHTYVDVAPLTRSANFYEDTDGLPFVDYDPEIAKNLLKQERFDDYMIVNVVGGKSWRVKNKFISVFATVNNLLGQEYKSDGFEQGRNANYRQLLEDKSLETPVFGNRYWYGRGTTYFLNINISL